MDEEDREAVLAAILRDTPKAFWVDLGARARQTYQDEFQQTAHNGYIMPEQKIDALYQSRHFKMEWLLNSLAGEHGLAASPTLLVENNRSYVYVAAGIIGMTQAYVPAIGDMPKPARFRERRASMNRIASEPCFAFGEHAPVLLEAKRFYGVIAHNPVGRRFEEGQQMLGMIQFCVPEPDCSGWTIQLPFQEILAAYPAAKPDKSADRDLPWKQRPAASSGDEE